MVDVYVMIIVYMTCLIVALFVFNVRLVLRNRTQSEIIMDLVKQMEER